MKNAVSLLALLLAFSIPALAQNPTCLFSGNLKDTSGATIIGAVLKLTPKDNPEETPFISLTDEEGDFELQLPQGDYGLKIQYLGQVVYDSSINLTKEKVYQSIILQGSLPATNLQEVTIKGERPKVKLENGTLVFTPNLVTAESAWDLVKITPMVFVKGEIISLLGKDNPIITINGRTLLLTGPALENYIKSIPSKNVQSIQVTPNTLANDDADSKAGSINIVLKEIEKGYEGQAYVGYSQATRPSVFSGGSFTLSSEKIQWTSSVNYYFSQNHQLATNDIFYPDYQLNERNITDLKSTSPNVSTSLDYRPNKSDDFQLDLSFNRTDYKNKVDNSSLFFTNISSDSLITVGGTTPQLLQSFSVDGSYEHKFDSLGRTITIGFSHFRQQFDQNQTLFNTTSDGIGNVLNQNAFKNGNDQNMRISTLNIDTKLPTTFASFSLGAKLTFIANLNHSSFYRQQGELWQPDNNLFDHFNYYENTQALYAQGDKKFGKWNLTLGLRAERTTTKGHSIVYQENEKRLYFMLFPSGNLSYNPNENNSFSLTYSRKVTRPYFAQVNPFVNYQNDYAFFRGNPFLQPYFTRRADLMYLYQQRWNFALSGSRSNNMFSEIEMTEPNTSDRIGQIENFLNFSALTFDVSTSYQIAKWWGFYPSVELSRYWIYSTESWIKDGSSFTGSIEVYNQIQLTRNQQWYLSLSGHYYLPNKAGVMQGKAALGETVGLLYMTKNQKWQWSLSANDLFKTDKMRYNSIVNNILRVRSKYDDSRYVMLSVRYNFKKGKVEKVKKMPKLNSEEMRRVKN